MDQQQNKEETDSIKHIHKSICSHEVVSTLRINKLDVLLYV